MSTLHLDSMYKNRWEEFYLNDGIIKDSRQINWRNVEWDKVIKIVAHLKKSTFVVDNKGSGFRAFMNFRWGGAEAMYEKGKYLGHKKIHVWTIGWTDGVTCFLKNIDFKTCQLIDECVSPIGVFVGHVHPAVHQQVFGGK